MLVNPGGLAHFLPSVVAVVDLTSGATVRAATSTLGSAVGPSVEPGREIHCRNLLEHRRADQA
jgi:hypothetical protein